ncbi:hypothetical protein BGZ60DRAFT_546204 [Tricladium varicosporioides]|nr:hypothetical protein BGZ60DRAFT_546204 [Hymenoscyphus varicosporioides]
MHQLHAFVLVIMPVNHLDSCATAQAATISQRAVALIFCRHAHTHIRTHISLPADDQAHPQLSSLTQCQARTSNRVRVRTLRRFNPLRQFPDSRCDWNGRRLIYTCIFFSRDSGRCRDESNPIERAKSRMRHHVWARQLKRPGEPVGAEREVGKGEQRFDRLFSAGAGYLGLTIGRRCATGWQFNKSRDLMAPAWKVGRTKGLHYR